MAKMNQAMTDLLRYNAAILPQKRSSFNKSHSHTTTLDSGYLVPVMWDRVVPGDEKKIRYSGLARMATPIHPVMDEANLDVWAFFVPDRLWWNHAKEFYGENKEASFNPDGMYTMPYLAPDQYYVDASGRADTSNPNSVMGLSDYFGFPTYNGGSSTFATAMAVYNANGEMRCTAGLHRSYQLIWNEWFRNSSVQSALQLNDGDTVTSAEWNVIKNLRKVCKYPDYFTTLLREPQAGNSVMLPLGEWAPVVTRTSIVPNPPPVSMTMTIPNQYEVIGFGRHYLGVDNDGLVGSFTPDVSDSFGEGLAPNNLWADFTNASRATVENLRAAITVQQLLETDAMAGKRYQNILQAHFGVFTPDATLQRPELLGASRTPIGMRQVLQTSSTDSTSPQGNVAAFSVTNVSNEWICNKSFTEPGFILVLAAVRPVHSYSQGIDPLLQKLNRYDHYWPVFDNLANQPVYNREIVASFNDRINDPSTGLALNDVFGYKEAWVEYRIKNNRVSGLMRPDVVGSLASWNYSSDFEYAPVLNSSFVEEDPSLIDRTIAVPSEPQFILDNYFDYIDIKNMSVHSIPGLMRL